MSPRRRWGLIAASALAVGSVAAVLSIPTAAPVAVPGPVSGDAADSSAAPEVAEAALRRLRLFRSGGSGDVLSLGSEEVTALLRHAVPGMLPPGVLRPSVRMESGRVRVDAQLATREFAASEPLRSALGVLPDTVEVELHGHLAAASEGVVFVVEEARASHVPLPRSVVVAVANSLASRAGERMFSDGSEEAALAFAWPSGVDDAEVSGGRLVLRRGERIGDRAVDGSDGP